MAGGRGEDLDHQKCSSPLFQAECRRNVDNKQWHTRMTAPTGNKLIQHERPALQVSSHLRQFREADLGRQPKQSKHVLIPLSTALANP